MKIILHISILFLITLFCQKSYCQTNGYHIDLPENNVFKTDLNEAVNYSKATGEDLEKYVNAIILGAETEVTAIINQSNPTLENTFTAYDQVYNILTCALKNANIVMNLWPESKDRAAGERCAVLAENALANLNINKALFAKLQEFTKGAEYNTISATQRRFVDGVIAAFLHAGVTLDDQKTEKVKQLNTEIAALNRQFLANFNNSAPVISLNKEEADGLTEAEFEKYKKGNDLFEIPLLQSNYSSLIATLKVEESRKKLHILWQTRGSGNTITLDSLVSKRNQLAVLMGYTNYADYQLTQNMLKSRPEVQKMLDGLVASVRPSAITEYNKLKSIRNLMAGIESDEPVNPWNYAYYNANASASVQDFGKQVNEYNMSLSTCTNGLLKTYEKILGLEFRQISDPQAWHSSVTAYDVYGDGRLKGRFYMDMFSRDGKEKFFKIRRFVGGRKAKDGFEVPSCVLIANFLPPTEANPASIKLNDLTVFFHEFGHIMNRICYDGDYAFQSDPTVDFVESLSKMFENWLQDYDVVKTIVLHPKTGLPISQELFDQWRENKKGSVGMQSLRQFGFALYSLQLYSSYNPQRPIHADSLWVNIERQFDAYSIYVPGTHEQNNFVHLTQYGAAYYGYIWSNLLAQDMFTVFKKNGLADPTTGKKFRKLIMANGVQMDEMEAVEAFLGRKVNNEAYTQWLGL